MVDPSTMTDDELAEAYQLVLAEVQARHAERTAQQRAEQAAADAEAVNAERPPRTYAPGMVVGPGERVVEGGKEYRNTSRAWLSVPPSQYPMGYQLTTPPATAAPWKAGETVKAGDLRSYGGVVYKCIQSHTTQAGWEPPAVPALWAVA